MLLHLPYDMDKGSRRKEKEMTTIPILVTKLGSKDKGIILINNITF